MALDSHSVMFPSCSTDAFPLGFNAKNSGLRCSPCSSLSATISCATPSSLSARRTFCGLMNHDTYSFLLLSSCTQSLHRRLADTRARAGHDRGSSSKSRQLIDPPDRKTIERGERMRSALCSQAPGRSAESRRLEVGRVLDRADAPA